MNEPFSIVCLSGQEWDVDLPTNRQQIMLRAARRGHQVLFVETGGFLLTYVWACLRHPARRPLRHVLTGAQAEPGIRVWKAPNIVPWGRKFRLANRLNCAVTARLARRLVSRLRQPAVGWIYDPLAASVAGRCGERLVAYDCVDDYVEQAGGSRRRRALVAEGDEVAARRAAVVFATTTPLYERQRRRNERTHLVRNVGDFDHFASASTSRPQEILSVARPIVGFAGNFLATKVDFELLFALARKRPDWTLLLVGPARDETRDRLERLADLTNVSWIGPRPYSDLPRYINCFDVGLIPYVSNAYTRSCFPLKLFEYLAAGKPVVASGLPELAGMEPDVLLVDGVDDFAAAVEIALSAQTDADRKRRADLASRNTWDSRAERLLDLVAQELGR